MEEEVQKMNNLGYPFYFLTIFGPCKFPGVKAILVAKYPLLKEWAYAGFFFIMSEAVFSCLAAVEETFGYFDSNLLHAMTFTF
ncbi:MAG: DoxX family protein [Cyclobacteriaceae bacterium]|nr:DoxX family protein [Cyclobacteriaceae bacterium]